MKNEPGSIKKMVKTMTDTVETAPMDIADTATKTEVKIWEMEIDQFVKNKRNYKSNKVMLHSVIWGQCSEAMQAKVKTDPSFQTIHDNSDSLALIKIIKGIAYKFESQQNMYLALDNAKSAFYTL
jgi:hypothetical protein